MYSFDHDCLGENCIYCALLHKIQETLQFINRFVKACLIHSSDDLINLIRSAEEQPRLTQIIALMAVKHEEGFPSEKPKGLKDDLWKILLEADNPKISHALRLPGISLLLCIMKLDASLYYLNSGDFHRAIDTYGDACMDYGEGAASVGAAYGKSSSHTVAKLGAASKLKSDPKQVAKANVLDCWNRWQRNPHEYKSKAAFAKSMLEKYEVLQSQRVIERWCKDWESEPCQQST